MFGNTISNVDFCIDECFKAWRPKQIIWHFLNQNRIAWKLFSDIQIFPKVLGFPTVKERPILFGWRLSPIRQRTIIRNSDNLDYWC